MQPHKVFTDENPKPDLTLFELLYAIFRKMTQPKHYSVHSDRGMVPDGEPARFVPAELPSLFPSTRLPSGLLVYGADWTPSGTRKHSILVEGCEIVAINDKLKPDNERRLTLQELEASDQPLQVHADKFVEYLRKGISQGSSRE
jgi:hypothetical protein